MRRERFYPADPERDGRASSLTPVGATVRRLVEPLLNHPQSRAQLLWRDWRRCVGSRVASHTEPVRLDRHALTVRVDSPAWMNQLTFLKGEILQALQVHLPALDIRELRFQQGSLQFAQPETTPVSRPLPPPTPEEQAQAEEILSGVSNPELHATLKRLICKHLARKRDESLITPSPTGKPG
ncbi:MAG: DUF721 domain-containing protein [Magnetococcales bacterium]|nr:DUF721 domain-containing protein [Magnetococcales bacterium]